ncbi:MAG: beta-ketoacyl-ACP synthase III, partial [Halopseudomonas aestusnigri]|nr:beta-ketoacyl-ACP synthase III [Halopseudomonas aestusnigri]
MHRVVISGTGLFTPSESISNEELVASYNAYVERFNAENAAAIEAGSVEPLACSSTEFIEKASGIKARYVINKSGILDVDRMVPSIPERSDDEQSLLCEMAVKAAHQALEAAGRTPADIDGVIVACSNLPRAYPALSVEVQEALGIEGFGFDMNVACSSATFGIQNAANTVALGQARAVLMVNPEVCTGHMSFRDRDSHFIFGDACTAVVIERAEDAVCEHPYEILGTKLLTKF